MVEWKGATGTGEQAWKTEFTDSCLCHKLWVLRQFAELLLVWKTEFTGSCLCHKRWVLRQCVDVLSVLESTIGLRCILILHPKLVQRLILVRLSISLRYSQTLHTMMDLST